MEGMGAQTWPDQFSPAIADQLVAGLSGYTRDRVFSSGHTDEIHLRFPPNDQFITLFFTNFPVDQNMVTGGGSINTAFDSQLEVRSFIRLEADIEGRTTRLLEDEVFGVYKTCKDILTILQIWYGPPDPASNMSMFRRPMRIAPGFRIDRKAGVQDSRWSIAHMFFEVSFVSSIGSPYSAYGG